MEEIEGVGNASVEKHRQTLVPFLTSWRRVRAVSKSTASAGEVEAFLTAELLPTASVLRICLQGFVGLDGRRSAAGAASAFSLERGVECVTIFN